MFSLECFLIEDDASEKFEETKRAKRWEPYESVMVNRPSVISFVQHESHINPTRNIYGRIRRL